MKRSEQKQAVRKHLGTIANYFEAICGFMNDIPHRRGVVHLPLEGEAYLVHVTKTKINGGYGITSSYQDADGNLYEISIHKR